MVFLTISFAHVVEVDTMHALWETLHFIVASLYRRGVTTLVFLPGKAEITRVRDALVAMQIGPSDTGSDLPVIDDLHGELEPGVIARVKRGTSHTRVILATSFAEGCVTIPDVDHVVDAGLSRTSEEYHDILEFGDTIASEAVQMQRAGRTGRVKQGAHTVLRVKNAPPPTDLRLSSASVSKVIVLEDFHLKIRASACALCDIPEDTMAEARAELDMLNLPNTKLQEAVVRIPLALRDAAVLFKAIEVGVGYEAAAILAVKKEGRWPPSAVFVLQDMLRVCENPVARWQSARPSLSGDGTQDEPKIGFQDKISRVFHELVRGYTLKPWDFNDVWRMTGPRLLNERLAVAFLVCPERLIWNRHGIASFLGATLDHSSNDEYFVGVLLSRRYRRRLQCNLAFPISDWVVDASGVTKPTRTANVNGDSTLAEFRRIICAQLRTHGYDVRRWCAKAGAWEEQVAVEVATSPRVDLNLVAPNGNRLAHM